MTSKTDTILNINKMPNHAVICLMAPTASGKTALAYELYDTGRFELISVDSALIYRDMDIGTAKPTKLELLQYPHHLVDIIDPTQTYSVANFVNDVEVLVAQIHQRGKIPILVGGTMMYYMALFTGLSPVPETDALIRDEVEAWREQVGVTALHAYLEQVDPVIAERLNKGDTQRVTRAVEVFKQTGRPLSYWQQLPKIAIADNPDQYWLGIAVMPDRPWLHGRIEQRLEIMWNKGLIDEVIGLLSKYSLTPQSAALRCVGYRQVVDYLVQTGNPAVEAYSKAVQLNEKQEGYAINMPINVACEDMKNKALYATRQLAKRQYTWLRNLIKIHNNTVILQDKYLNEDLLPANLKVDTSDFLLLNKSDKSSKMVVKCADIGQAKQIILNHI